MKKKQIVLYVKNHCQIQKSESVLYKIQRWCLEGLFVHEKNILNNILIENLTTEENSIQNNDKNFSVLSHQYY